MPRKSRLTEEQQVEVRALRVAGFKIRDIVEAYGFTPMLVAHLGSVRRMREFRCERLPDRLAVWEREEISRAVKANESDASIARRLGRHRSTISREVKRSGRGRAFYRAWRAEDAAFERARRPKPRKLETNARLRAEVEKGLRALLSPQQIAASLALRYPNDLSMQVSHETIYASLFVQGRGGLRKELAKCLRTGRTQRRSRSTSAVSSRVRFPGMVMISERPAEIEDRAVPGHWEGDLVIGRRGASAIGTLVERHSRFVMLMRLPNGRSAEDVRKALVGQIRKLPTQLRGSLTWDQGTEMADHARFTVESGVQVYFCDPHSPWQRGSNENTNGLLRQYLPKKEDLSVYSQAQLNRIARSLNTRPRQTLGWLTPSEVLRRVVAPTA